MTVRDEVLLMQLPDGPLLVRCYFCEQAALVGEYVVVADLADAGRAALCGSCAGQVAPELAACCEALGVLAVTARDLSPEHAVRVLCVLVEQIARLVGPTVALLNVNPLIVERINCREFDQP